jgi:hypothetical protein
MAKDFLDFEFQMELNEKYLDKYHSLFEQTMGKISLISLVYSIIAVYTVQFAPLVFSSKLNLFFSICFIFLILLVILSLTYTVKFMLPISVSHMHSPAYFYKQIKSEYQTKKKITDKKILNQYIQATYLQEIEHAVKNNFQAFNTKRNLFYKAFTFGLMAFIPYLICLSIYLGQKKESAITKVEIVNKQVFEPKK